ATTNTPVATTVMILEMSLSFDLVIPLAICISVSYLVSGGTSLYEGQKVTRDDEIQGFYGDVNILPSKTPKFVNRDDSLDGSDSDRNSTKS
ncbi:MAG: hypothetical protein ACXAEN_24570, partial [Candidatus Thorarchaeota archaeon]